MKILISGMTYNQGGKETYILGIYSKLISKGHQIDFLATDSSIAHEDEIINNGSHVYHVTPRSKDYKKYRKDINNIFQSQKYDVVWSHKTTLSSIEELEIAKKYGVPIRIIHSHCTQNMGGKFTAVMHAINKKRVTNIATDFFACSRDAGKYFFVNSVDFKIVNNAFDIEKYRYNKEIDKRYRDEFGFTDDYVVLHVGRFSPEKNHKKLIEVFDEITKRIDKAQLILCGSGDGRTEVERLISEKGLASRCHIFENRSDINCLQQMANVFVFPSIHEGLPYALMEAQAAGTPCVISSTLSDDTIFFDVVKKMDLHASASDWADACLEMRKIDKANVKNTFADRGFDLELEASRIDQYMHDRLKTE